MVNNIKNRPCDGQRSINGQSHNHVANLANDMKRKDFFNVILACCTEYASEHGQRRNPQ
ncbi:Uncharacterised protein [Vibrio cholerae]|nr:Uncharacterised protein [Vibrio cholerae]